MTQFSFIWWQEMGFIVIYTNDENAMEPLIFWQWNAPLNELKKTELNMTFEPWCCWGSYYHWRVFLINQLIKNDLTKFSLWVSVLCHGELINI